MNLSIDPSFVEAIADAVIARMPKMPEPPLPDAPQLVDGARLADLLSISRPTVDRLRRDGRIPSIMIGTRRLYDPTDVVAALKEAS